MLALQLLCCCVLLEYSVVMPLMVSYSLKPLDQKLRCERRQVDITVKWNTTGWLSWLQTAKSALLHKVTRLPLLLAQLLGDSFPDDAVQTVLSLSSGEAAARTPTKVTYFGCTQDTCFKFQQMHETREGMCGDSSKITPSWPGESIFYLLADSIT